MAAVLVQRVLFEILRLLIVFEVWSHVTWLLLPRISNGCQRAKQSPTVQTGRLVVGRHTLDVMVSLAVGQTGLRLYRLRQLSRTQGVVQYCQHVPKHKHSALWTVASVHFLLLKVSIYFYIHSYGCVTSPGRK